MRIAVLGAGAVGSSVAELAADYGHTVTATPTHRARPSTPTASTSRPRSSASRPTASSATPTPTTP